MSEEQVAQAALAMVSPTTEAITRRQASQFLEEWTSTPEAWDIYAKWLQHFRLSEHKTGDQVAMQLLCLTMLQTKLRKEIPRGAHNNNPRIALVRQELWEYLRQPQLNLDVSLRLPCCICNAAIIVRCGMLSDLLNMLVGANTHHETSLSCEMALKLLACIPSEMEACRDLTTPQVTEQLVPHLAPVLETVRSGLQAHDHTIMLPACQTLKEWVSIAHISLSQLNNQGILPLLIQILSSNPPPSNDEKLLQVASQALTAAIMDVSDSCTPEREAAVATFWSAITSHGFLVTPLQVATHNGWDDACHALATVLCTFVNEQVDDLVTQPAQLGLQVLLEIQSHPHTPVALIPLDCWLTIQEIPSNSRHEHWQRPLFAKVVETLLRRIAYPPTFTNWQNELDVDSSEFQEMRRMVTDVLVSSYFLLRVELIQLLANQIVQGVHHNQWASAEAALYCLTQISKDVCARCKSHAADGTSIAQDRNTTCQELLHLLNQLMPITQQQQQLHPLLLGAIITFSGSYSLAWNSMDCPPQAILQLLTALQSSFVLLPMEAAKATRAIYIACLSKSMPNLEDLTNNHHQSSPHSNGTTILPLVLKSMRDSMDAALSTNEEDAMTIVTEGAIRLVTKLKDPNMARQALIKDLIHPVLHRGQSAMQIFPTESTNHQEWLTPTVHHAVESLVTYLSVIQIVVRFCDAPHIPTMGEWMLHEVGPFLETVQRQTASTPAQGAILPKWISIHQQLLRSHTIPQQSIMVALFSNTIPMVVQVLEQTQDPSALKYMSSAVEVFGGGSAEMDYSFQELLSHVTTVVTSQGSNLSDATELLQAYFECLQRYILYCPKALCNNPQLPTILSLAVDSITVLQGAKESTRAALVFLYQLFGWNLLRLSPQVHQVLQEAWHGILKQMLVHHGQTLIQACVVGLAGGPQMLWPAYSDCLYAIAQAVVITSAEGNNTDASSASSLNESLIQHWLYNSMNSAVSSTTCTGTGMTAGACKEVIAILLGLVRLGPKSKPKAKMLLTDFAKITKGEMAPNALLSYAIP